MQCAVLVNDVQEFTWKMIEKRKQDTFNVKVKVFVDSSGGFFKLGIGTVNVASYFSGDITKRSNYTKGICPNLKKETPVDQTLLLGIVLNIQENYDNYAVFFKSIDLRDIQFTLCGDLKLLTLILGLQSHTSNYPCYFCNKSTDCIDWLFSTGDK